MSHLINMIYQIGLMILFKYWLLVGKTNTNNSLDFVSRHNCIIIFMYPSTDCELPVVSMTICPPKP